MDCACVVSLLFEGTEEHRAVLLSLLGGHAVRLAMQMYGCRVIQRALEVVDPILLVPLVKVEISYLYML